MEKKKNMNMMLDEFKRNGKVSSATQPIGVSRAPQGNNKSEFVCNNL